MSQRVDLDSLDGILPLSPTEQRVPLGAQPPTVIPVNVNPVTVTPGNDDETQSAVPFVEMTVPVPVSELGPSLGQQSAQRKSSGSAPQTLVEGDATEGFAPFEAKRAPARPRLLWAALGAAVIAILVSLSVFFQKSPRGVASSAEVPLTGAQSAAGKAPRAQGAPTESPLAPSSPTPAAPNEPPPPPVPVVAAEPPSPKPEPLAASDAPRPSATRASESAAVREKLPAPAQLEGSTVPEELIFGASFQHNRAQPENVRPGEVERVRRWAEGCAGALLVTGHASSVGPESVNRDFGHWRAQAVRQYLARKGITKPMRVRTAGSQQPVEAGASEEASARNRRVVLTCE